MIRSIKSIFALFVCAVALSSCSKTNEDPAPDLALLQKTWIGNSLSIIADGKETMLPASFEANDNEFTFQANDVFSYLDGNNRKKTSTWKSLGSNKIEITIDGEKRVFEIASLSATNLALNTAKVDLVALGKKDASKLTSEEDEILSVVGFSLLGGLKIDEKAKELSLSYKFKVK